MTHPATQPRIRRLAELRQHRTFKYAASVALVALATGLQMLTWSLVEPAPYLFYYPVVILAALYGDGTSAILLSALAAQYWFIKPYHTLAPNGVGDVLRAGVFLAASFGVRALTRNFSAALRRAEEANAHLRHERELRDIFVATLSHDLRNPLAAARTAVALLKRQASPTVPYAHLFDRAIHNIDRADRMVEDLLDANRIEVGQPLPLLLEDDCDLARIADEVTEELRRGGNFELRAVSAGDVRGRWSSDGLRRVLENLARNAVKYGDTSRPVTVKTERDGERARALVHNYGNPIAPEDLGKLFAPFARTRAAERSGKEGWGLGLAVVRGIVESHGGDVDVESSPEHGTTFTVTLPIAGPTAADVTESRFARP